MENIVEVFGALSERTRLRLYMLLLKAGSPVAVCELIDALGESQYNVSKHLQILKSKGLVKESRKGRWVFYSPAESAEPGIAKAVSEISNDVFVQDYKVLKKRMALRKNGEIVSCKTAGELMETFKGGSK